MNSAGTSSLLVIAAIAALILLVAGGAAYMLVRPEPRTVAMWTIPVIVGIAVFVGLQQRLSAPTHFEEHMRRDGVAATATITKVESSSVLVNRRAQVKLTLEIEVPNSLSYQMQTLQLVPIGQAAQPGRRLIAYVIPDDHEQILIDWTSAPQDREAAEQGGTIEQRLEELERLHQRQLISEDEYQLQRHRLLSEL